MDRGKLIRIISETEQHIRAEEYKGYDPFDILNSPLFKLPLLRNNKFIRLLSQQVYRRLPFNIRTLLGIQKEINPVTLGLCIQAYSNLALVFPDKKKEYLEEIKNLLTLLLSLSSRGYSGISWGYNFDWEARYAKINKFVPTVVATGIITNSLFEYYKSFNDESIKDIITGAAEFVLNDLNRSTEDNKICFSYSPEDKQRVYNASMKGARLLAQAYSLTQNQVYFTTSEQAVRFVVSNQNADGSWPYAKGDARTWIDNFHTAYILDALDEFIKITGKTEYSLSLSMGLDYYIANLFTGEGYPKYYSTSFYPVDSTETAQSIITLIRFGLLDKAQIVSDFSINYLYSNNGYFYYQRKKNFSIKTSFMRWSNAYMFLALSEMLRKINA